MERVDWIIEATSQISALPPPKRTSPLPTRSFPAVEALRRDDDDDAFVVVDGEVGCEEERGERRCVSLLDSDDEVRKRSRCEEERERMRTTRRKLTKSPSVSAAKEGSRGALLLLVLWNRKRAS